MVIKMLIVGLTGGIASGKSTISDYLKEMGAVIIDADLLARQVVEPGKRPGGKLKSILVIKLLTLMIL